MAGGLSPYSAGFRAGQMNRRSEDDRFESGAQEYAAYLETPEGRLREELAFANLQDFLPPSGSSNSLDVLDVGCGTGTAAVRLARLGFHVTQLDSSQAMLNIARSTAERAGVTNGVTTVHGNASQVMDLFGPASFDLVLCHNVLEYVEDPAAVVRGAAHVLRGPSAILSVVVRNQAGEVLKAAIQTGDLVAAEANLNAEWGFESLYGGKVRLFTSAGLRTILKAESLESIAQRGIRVIADHLPARISREAEYERIFELERKLGQRPEFAAVARYTQCLARRAENAA